MADLKINYAETKTTGNNVTTKGNEFTNLLTKIKNVNSQLTTAWEGTDASKYTSSVAEQAAYMQKLADTINEIGTFLVQVGNAYEDACRNNANAIK